MSKAADFIKRDDIRGIYPEVLNGDVAEALGYATGKFLIGKYKKASRIAVGYDCRHGNLEIAKAFQLGISKSGCEAIELGLCSTEYVYYFCGSEMGGGYAGAMITASHNPKEFNGIKLIHQGCLPFTSDDLQTIGASAEMVMEKINPNRDFQKYAKHLLSLSGMDTTSRKSAFKIVVHAGNGMGAFAFQPIAKLLKHKGVETVIVDGVPNGDFPNGVPNPLLGDFMQRLAEAVLTYKADLGIGFDGDADRAGFVDAAGKTIIPSYILALIGQSKLSACKKESPMLLRNLCCSQLLKHLFKDDNVLMDTPVGHGRIKQIMRCNAMGGRVLFAGEHSGHYFYPEFNYVDSGVLTALYMIDLAWSLKEKGQKLTGMLKKWDDTYAWSGEINFDVDTRENLLHIMKTVWEQYCKPGVLRYEIAMDETMGVQRVFETIMPYNPETALVPDLKMVSDCGENGWWFVLRPSGNEPKLRLNVEAWGINPGKKCCSLTRELCDFMTGMGAVRK